MKMDCRILCLVSHFQEHDCIDLVPQDNVFNVHSFLPPRTYAGMAFLGNVGRFHHPYGFSQIAAGYKTLCYSWPRFNVDEMLTCLTSG